MSMYAMMLVLGIIGFAVTAALKLGPHYIDNRVVASALQSVKEQYAGQDLAEVKDRDIKGVLGKFFEVNMVDDSIMENFEVVREKNNVTLKLNYEIRKPFMGNVDVVLIFNNEVELGK